MIKYILQRIHQRFDGEFSFVQIFNTDNFEDPEHIHHPCYNHAGIAKAFREFLDDSIIEALTEVVPKIIGEKESRGTFFQDGEEWEVVADASIDGRNHLRAKQLARFKELVEELKK